LSARRHLSDLPSATRKTMTKRFIAALALAIGSAAAWALPTTQEVETAVQQGHDAQAETMMSEVVAAKPDSAKAHYVYAEVLAHNGSFAKARQEATRARQLDPAIKFTSSEKFSAFEQLLQREQIPQARNDSTSASSAPILVQPTPASPGIPGWVWVAGLAVIGFVLWRGLSRSRAAALGGLAGGPQSVGPAGGLPWGAGASAGMPAAGMPAYGSGIPSAPGSGMLGTGLAVAGGVAGGMLLDEMLHHRQGIGPTPPRSRHACDLGAVCH
jgi:hypothetical protein